MMKFTLVIFIIRIYSQSSTIYSFVEPFLTTYSTESADFGYDEIHSSTYFLMISVCITMNNPPIAQYNGNAAGIDNETIPIMIGEI